MKSQLFVLAFSAIFSITVLAQTQKGSSSTSGINPAVCNQLIPQIRPQADNCLKIKDLAQRTQCFDQVGKIIQKSAPNGACDQVLNPIKQEYITKEKQLYPTQGSALNGPQGSTGSQPNNGTQSNNGSQPNNGSQGKVDPAICNKLITQLRPQADNCLKIKDQAQRTQCFDQVGKSIQQVAPNGACDQILNPVKQEYITKEKQLYPTQPSALGGPNGNQGSQGNMSPQMSAAVCDKLGKSITPLAEACLKIKEQPKRAQCFDQIGQSMQKTAPNGGCDQFLNPLKQQFMAKEKQLYPTQAPALK